MKKILSQARSFVQKFYSDRQPWIVFLTIGVWIVVLQNFGVFHNEKEQRVFVVGGDIDADVSGHVSVDGSVSIENTVDVNLQEINGYRNCFYNDSYKHPDGYYSIPVVDY